MLAVRNKNPTFVYLAMAVAFGFCFSAIATPNLVYMVEVAHLDPFRLLLVGTVLELTCLVFQVPTGLFADAFSRRWAVGAGCALVGAGFILEGLVPQFTAIALSQVIWGAGATLWDGADDAWITDEVGEDAAGRLFLRASQLGQASSLVGIAVGVGLAAVRLNLPIVIGGGLFVLLALYLLYAMTEAGYDASHSRSRGTLAGMVAGARSSIGAIQGRPLIVTILAITAVWGLSGEGIDRLYQVHLIKDIGLPRFLGLSPVVWFGLISGGSAVIGIVTTQVIRRRLDPSNHAHVTRYLLGFTALRTLMLSGFAFAGSLSVAIGFLWVANAMRQAFGPVQRAWLNQSLNPDFRATLFSVQGQADALGQIAGGPAIGAIASGVSIRAALVASAALLGIALPMFARAFGQGATPTLEVGAMEAGETSC